MWNGLRSSAGSVMAGPRERKGPGRSHHPILSLAACPRYRIPKDLATVYSPGWEEKMRTFQFSDAKSHKFWSIDVSGSSFTVTYGKVGTAGQTQTKSFATPEKAQAEADKLIREKTGKGYVETTAKTAVSEVDALE